MAYIITAEHTIPSSGNPDTTYYFATSTYVTRSTDFLPNIVFRGDIAANISLDKEIGFYAWGTQSKTTVSNITLINAPIGINQDGFYDGLINLKARDSKVVLKIVDQEASYDTAIQIGEFIVDDIQTKDDNFIKYLLLDKIALLDTNTKHNQFPDTIPFVNNRGVDEPIALGYVYQADLPIYDSVNNIYQNYSGVFNIGELLNLYNNHTMYDRADPLVNVTDYTWANTAFNDGTGFNLRNQPDGKITCDYIGKRSSNIQSNTFNGFVRALAIDSIGLSITDIDVSAAAQIDTDYGYLYGYYVKTAENAKAILTRACSSHCGFFYQNNAGEITFDILNQPKINHDFEIKSINIASGINISIDTAPGLSDGAAARKNVYVYNYDNIRDIGGLSEEDKQKASSQYQYYCRSTVTQAGNKAFDDTYAHARNGCYLPTLLTEKADAESFIQQNEDLYNQERKFYDFDFIDDDIVQLLTRELNETFKLTYNRYGLQNGKNLVLTRLKINNLLQSKAQIRGWG